MFKPLYAFIGYRYSRVKRKNHFISFISQTSMISIALGVMVLITVMSVMNGFHTEIRAQMLSLAPHITVKSHFGNLNNWGSLFIKIKQNEEVLGAAPFVLEQGMLTKDGFVQGVAVRGVVPEEINDVFPMAKNIKAGSIDALSKQKYGVVIGISLATRLNIWLGDSITLLVPEANISPIGVTPRLKRFTVVGVFDTATMYDERNIFINLKDANVLYRLDNSISGIQLKIKDELEAKRIANLIAEDLDNKYYVEDWTREYAGFFEAIKMEKTVMWCILVLIIAVAGFNLVSSLVMMVTDKRPDIAIIRTIGASKRSIMGIFMMQGVVIGTIGTALGLGLGLLLAYNVTVIVEFIQQLFQVQFVSPDVYFIGYVPSEIHSSDIIIICLTAQVMSFVATIYPAYKAASIQPAEALRYE